MRSAALAVHPSTMRLTVLFAAVVFTGCNGREHQSSETIRVTLRDDARLVLERHCGNCHLPESPAALPAALAVYNLRDEEWAKRMSIGQLEKLGVRIQDGEFFDEFDIRNKGMTAPPRPREAEQQVVRDYVHAEIGARASKRRSEARSNPSLVSVPSAAFTMGCDPGRDPQCAASELPAHQAQVSAFLINRTEVTQSAYADCVNAGACTPPSSRYFPDRMPNRPVTQVTWHQANTYCEWRKQRLPTEAEWELAARGTDGRKYPWGDASPSCALAQTADCGPPADVGTHGAGASPFGAQDTAGNVDEWTADWFAPYGDASSIHTERVARGGAYDAWHSRSVARNALQPDYHDDLLGFRCAANGQMAVIHVLGGARNPTVNSWIAKVIVILASVVMIAIRAPHGQRSRGIKVTKSHRGPLELALLVIAWLGFFIPIIWIVAPVFSFADYPLEPIPLGVGALCVAFGLWVFYRSHKDLGTNWSITLEVRENHRLVTNGIYSRIRHPMYSALLLYSIGQALVLPNWLAGPSYLVAFGLLLVLRLAHEEKMMTEEFGGEYEAYVARSKRLIPGIW